jgi:hypothetical protein
VAKGDVVPGIRVLQHCSLVPTVSCTTLTVSNLPANIDLDGPDLRAQVGGQEELFFNGVVSGSPGQLYRATAATPAGPWSATEMVGVTMAGYDDGDPAVSDDGVVLIFGSKRPVFLPDNKLNLWVALRVLGSYVMVPSPFQEVFQVAVNSAENEGAPDLVTVDTGSKQILELYFTSDRKVPGVYAIYRAACWLE